MVKSEMDKLLFKAIRSSGLTKYIEVAKKDMLFEYIVSYVNDQEYFENYFVMINTLYKFRDELDDNERLILDKYESMLKNLKQKCLNNELDDTERIMYALILASSLVNNCCINLSDCSDYIANIYNKGHIYHTYEEVFLIIANTLNILNKEYNSNVALVFDENRNNICSYRYEDGRKEIVIGSILKYVINRFANKENLTYYSIVYYVVFAIMHEFYHSIQFPYGVQNSFDLDNPTYRKEGLVALFNKDFYNKFHNNFSFEIDADEFAFSNIESYISELMDDKKKKKSEFRVKCFRRISEGKLKISQKKVAEKLNQKYENIDEKIEKMLKVGDNNE